ncbi:MAG TPA: D-aminoacylase, partial [Thermoanaerobaculia bacterium]
MRWPTLTLLALLTACATTPPQPAPTYDIVIRNGSIYDGSGADAVHGDVAVRGDRIAAVGNVTGRGKTEFDARGMA